MQRWAGRADFYGVAWASTEDEFEAFIDKYDLSFPQISDEGGDVFARFEVPTQPAFAIIHPEGEVQTLFGAADDTLLDSLIEAALA